MLIKINRRDAEGWLLILEGKDKKELKSLINAIKVINQKGWEKRYREGWKAFKESQKYHDAVLSYLKDHKKA